MEYDGGVTGNARGPMAGVVAFGIWGVLPIYWKHLESINPASIVAQRTIWTCLLLDLPLPDGTRIDLAAL